MNGAILFFVLSICSASLYFFYSRSINISPQKSEHIYADITAGDITISGSRPISLVEWENNKNKPFKVSKKKDMLIIEPTESSTSEFDDVVLRVGVGGLYKVLLKDGTIVFLNSNSELSYKGDFLKNRILSLKGEAFFEVAKRQQAGIKQEFTVLTGKQRIAVLGTKFNVLSREKIEQTVLTEGSIALRSMKSGKNEFLVPGERAMLDDQGSIDKTTAITEDYTSWKDGNLYYENKSLRYILSDLANIYPIHFDPNKVPNRNFTLFLKRDRSFSEILDLIKRSGNLNITLKGHELIF
ncbi:MULTISPECIES: FecR family protein [Sphingobacterium]|uniref:FecR family protein n=1 Tax=Sphingobacterium TaxID=28453 RepID=UPI00142DCEED|nr:MULTISPECIES: FecR family protein [Sphingobacterium]QQT47007.1 FecR domain-containing protein [Sphingobacterium multivorum]QQT60475.1 FecR domain-containing protein [Sphingobacterium multivorum]